MRTFPERKSPRTRRETDNTVGWIISPTPLGRPSLFGLNRILPGCVLCETDDFSPRLLLASQKFRGESVDTVIELLCRPVFRLP